MSKVVHTSLETAHLTQASLPCQSITANYRLHTVAFKLNAGGMSACLVSTMHVGAHCTLEVCQPVCWVPGDQSTSGLKLVVKGGAALY